MTQKQHNTIFFNLGFWLFLWVIFSFSMLRMESAGNAAIKSLLLILALTLAVYIHNFIYDYFVIRKRYVLYAIFTALLVAFFGYLLDQLQKYTNFQDHIEPYGTLLFIMVFYTGIKFLRKGTQQQIKIKEEESRRAKAEMELKEMEAKQAHAELDLLKSQVNPHFLFNSLNSIYSLILSNSEIAGDAVLKLSGI